MEETINNRFEFFAKAGEGGMGSVFVVCDLLKDRKKYALKTIKHQILEKQGQEALLRFKQEFEVMTRLKHTNLVIVYDFGKDQKIQDYFIVMEYVEGKNLKELLIEKKWGKPLVSHEDEFQRRSLWGARDKSPVWLLLLANGILVAVWAVILFVIIKMNFDNYFCLFFRVKATKN